MENFDLAKIKGMCSIDAKAYLVKYFTPLNDGNHACYEDGKYIIKETRVISSTYFKRLPKELQDFYFKENLDIRRVTYELNKPTFFENYINLCPDVKSKNNIKYDDCSLKAKQGVDKMLSFIKEVLADGNEDSYQYLIKWIANMLQGGKNDACLYLKGSQGIGKSTLADFLQYHVVGNDLLLNTGSEPLKSHFNLILGGKLLVVFEELENFNASEWASISSVLKRYITGNTYMLQGKGTNAFQTNNMNNYIINSNNDSIKDDDGRRYYILDISTKYKGNHEYFGKLREASFNAEVGRAFYSYMMEVDTNSFIPQQYPITQSKLNSHVKRMDKLYCFIKDAYVLKKKDMKQTPKDLFEEFKTYCSDNGYSLSNKPSEKTEMAEKLKQVNLIPRKIGNNYYKYSASELLEIANKNKWIHELDEFSDNNDNKLDTKFDEDKVEAIIKEKDDEIKRLKEIIEKQKLEIEALKKSTDIMELL